MLITCGETQLESRYELGQTIWRVETGMVSGRASVVGHQILAIVATFTRNGYSNLRYDIGLVRSANSMSEYFVDEHSFFATREEAEAKVAKLNAKFDAASKRNNDPEFQKKMIALRERHLKEVNELCENPNA